MWVQGTNPCASTRGDKLAMWPFGYLLCFFEKLVSGSLTFFFSTNMAISEMKGQGWSAIPIPVKEGQQYINLNLGRLFVQQPPKKGKGLRGSFKLLRQHLQQGENYHNAKQN